MGKENILLHLNEAIQVVANRYIKESYDNVIDTINGASPDELAASLVDAMSPYFERHDWIELESEIYSILVYNDEENIKKVKDLLIATVNVIELFN